MVIWLLIHVLSPPPALPEDRVKDILVLVNTRIPIVKYRDAHTYDM